MSNTRTRDSQRSKVYRAEHEAFPDDHTRSSARVGFRTPTECEIWVGRVLRNERARKTCYQVALAFSAADPEWTTSAPDFWRWPARVRVEPSYGKGGARAWGSNLIRVSGYFRNPVILLHELAQLVAPARVKHGPIFAAMELALVRAVLGVAAHDRLKAAFKKHRVRFKPKRSLSPERKAALVERLGLARQRKAALASMTDEQYADLMAAKNDGADNIDDPRVLRFVVDRQNNRSLSTALALANSDGSYT